MKVYKKGKRTDQSNSSLSVLKRGGALLNSFINKLPVELHLPGFQFCGPGTKLEKRLARGDVGINPLDRACKEHDIIYSVVNDLDKRHDADRVLISKAVERLKAKDSSLGEKAAALSVIAIMKAKVKIGMGSRRIKKKSKKKSLKGRILFAPKRGGFLPFLLPLLGALGALGGGAASIASAVNKSKSDKNLLDETQRHNKAMEAKGKGLKKKKTGNGLKKKKVGKGKGLYVGPYQWYQKKYQ